jgi:hypothetical protein
MIEQFDLSERHARRLVGLFRDSYRRPPAINSENAELSAAITDIARRDDGSATGAIMICCARNFPA